MDWDWWGTYITKVTVILFLKLRDGCSFSLRKKVCCINILYILLICSKYSFYLLNIEMIFKDCLQRTYHDHVLGSKPLVGQQSPTQPCPKDTPHLPTPRSKSLTLAGLSAVMIHTQCALLSYWMGKLGEVMMPEGPRRWASHMRAAERRWKTRLLV